MSSKKKQNSRDIILQVSTELFARNGQSGVTMRQIASESGVTLPTIYHHFSNKEKLYRAVEQHLYSAHASELLEAIRSEGLPLQRLEQFIEALIDALIANPLYFQILHRGLLEDDPDNSQFLVSEVLQGVVDELRNLLDEIKPGLGHGIAPLYIFGTILGFLTLQSVASLLKRYKFPRTAKLQQKRALIRTIISSLEDTDLDGVSDSSNRTKRRKMSA